MTQSPRHPVQTERVIPEASNLVTSLLGELERLSSSDPDAARRLAEGVMHATARWKDSIAGGERLSEITLSIVLPVYNEQENIPELYRRLVECLAANASRVPVAEILFVDDGSQDATRALILERRRQDPRVRMISFSRNFGHQAALAAGVDYSHGKAVILLDADLQDPPELITRMLDLWQDGADVVYAVRQKRKESFLKRLAYHSFYRILQAASTISIPLDSGDCCLMDRRVVNHLKALPERNRFLRGLRSWIGYRQVPLHYEREARFAGAPKYTIRKLVRLALDGILAFSTLPLRLGTYCGLTLCAAGFIYFWYVIGFYVFAGRAPQGWTSLIVLVLLIGGAQLVLLGLIGEYIARIYDETKKRPTYLVREVVG